MEVTRQSYSKNENQDGSKTSSLGSDDEEADVKVTDIYSPASSKLSSHSKSMADFAKNVNPSQDGYNSSAKILSNLKEVFARELKNSKKTEDPRKFFKDPAVIDRGKVLGVADVEVNTLTSAEDQVSGLGEDGQTLE